MDRLRELVMLAIGEASMCYDTPPTGVFDDVRAKQIGEDLLEAIKQHEAEVLTRASLSHYMCGEPIERPGLPKFKQGDRVQCSVEGVSFTGTIAQVGVGVYHVEAEDENGKPTPIFVQEHEITGITFTLV